MASLYDVFPSKLLILRTLALLQRQVSPVAEVRLASAGTNKVTRRSLKHFLYAKKALFGTVETKKPSLLIVYNTVQSGTFQVGPI